MAEYIVSTFDYLILSSQPKFLNIELKKIRKRIMKKKWNEKNREKINEKSRIYSRDNPEKRKASRQKWKENNYDKDASIRKEWKQKNKDKTKQYNIKSNWRAWGLKNVDEVYEKYLSTTNCQLCDVELTYDDLSTKTRKVMDHSHVTHEFRYILCQSCNSKLPKHT